MSIQSINPQGAYSIRNAILEDQTRILEIYAEGIQSGDATFTAEIPSWEEWDGTYLSDCRMVAEQHGNVVGWAALKPASPRPVYRGVTDLSIYVDASVRGRGIGRRLLDALIITSEAQGIWTIRAHMFPENDISIRLHHSTGFRTIGTCERAGKMEIGPRRGMWRDVVLMERRSTLVGID